MSIKTTSEVCDGAMAEVAGLIKDHWNRIKQSIRDAESFSDEPLKKFEIKMGLVLSVQSKENVQTTVATAKINYVHGVPIKDESQGAFFDDHPKLPGMKNAGKGEKPKDKPAEKKGNEKK